MLHAGNLFDGDPSHCEIDRRCCPNVCRLM
jgi:hypothetical protein